MGLSRGQSLSEVPGGILRRCVTVLFDLSLSVLFFGMFSSNPELQRLTLSVLQELSERGYQSPTPDSPIRIYPLKGGTLGGHQGIHRSGVVQIRASDDRNQLLTTLRHELMHDAQLRSCPVRFPQWIEEATALAFAGEYRGADIPNEEMIAALRERVRIDAPLRRADVDTLRGLLALHGWPLEPCSKNKLIEVVLTTHAVSADLTWTLIHLYSGRTFLESGVQSERAPPGSLMKIPLAASLSGVRGESIGIALAQSDTDFFGSARKQIDLTLLDHFLYPLRGKGGQSLCAAPPCSESEVRALAGERLENGQYLWQGTVREVALLLRRAILWNPGILSTLARPEEIAISTVRTLTPDQLQFLEEQKIAIKTGTISSATGHPLVGHVAALWPADQPRFLWVARMGGTRGSAVLQRNFELLRGILIDVDGRGAPVRVQLLSAASGYPAHVHTDCGMYTPRAGPFRGMRYAGCGELEVVANAPGALPRRRVRGLLADSEEGRLVLMTDEESYADGVILAEGDTLPSEAKRALRAVVVMNARAGGHRHGATRSLCDTTHCMVYRGSLNGPSGVQPLTDQRLLDQLGRSGRSWLQFSLGGVEQWERTIPQKRMLNALKLPDLLTMMREQEPADGAVYYRIHHTMGEQRLHCDHLRKSLELPACPDRISQDVGSIHFSGIGVGHGNGLNIKMAHEAAERGRSAIEILRDAYER